MTTDYRDEASPRDYKVDVCVIGAGAAGYALARELRGSGKSVLMIAGGGAAVLEAEQSLYEAEIAALPYTGHIEGRFRVDGGSTTRWGGQLLPLEKQDFRVRDWIPMSGWPFDGELLRPYYERAIDLMGTNVRTFGEEVYGEIGEKPPSFDPDLFNVRFSQWSPGNRRNFAEFLRRDFEGSTTTILRNAHVSCLVSGGDSVSHAEIVAFGGKKGRVEAETFVIACGGIENCRVLLASDGLGNENGMVGRCYQDHLSFPLGRFAPEDAAQVRTWFQPVYRDGILRTAKIAMSGAAQEAHRTLNVMALVAFPYPESSAPMAARRILQGVRRKPRALPRLGDVLQALMGVPDLGSVAYNQIVRKRRAVPRNGDAVLVINMEQAPNRESTISLIDERDALGIPRVRIAWRLTELERHTLRTYVDLLDAEWKRMGFRPIQWEPYAKSGDDAYLSVLGDIYHHMGGTRMSTTPKEGVVDPECRVHGVRNLYVAGSSVFPTGGSSNPTLTLLALAIRLGDRLKAA